MTFKTSFSLIVHLYFRFHPFTKSKAERQDIPINEVLPNQQEKDAMSETSAVEKKEEAKDTDSSNTVTKESEIHSDNVQIERAEALSEKAEIAVEKNARSKTHRHFRDGN